MKILVLAGGSDQIALIQEIKKHGHTVLLADYFENPPARPYADKHFPISTLDIQAVKELAESENVDLITTACTDQALLTVAKVSEEIGLPCYLSYQTALNVTNKAYMKKVMIQQNIPTSKYIITDNLNIETTAHLQYPLVVKPVDCNSSKGVKRVENQEQLSTALTDAIHYSRTSTAIVEEFKTGTELSVDCYIENGIAKLLSVTSSNKIKNTDSFTIIQSYYPAIPSDTETEILLIAQQITKAFNLKNTPLLIQMIYDGKDFFVVEFSARMGGGSKYKLIEYLSGVDIMKEYVNLVLGNPVHISPQKKVKYACMNYIYCTPGILHQIKNLDLLKSQADIQEYFVYKTQGMKIEKANTSSDRAAGFLITASNLKDMMKKLQKANDTIQVLDPQGKDIMKHDIYL